MENVPQVGQQVTYVDEYQRPRVALVTHVGFQKPETWINLAIVNLDENQKDDYGRKLERRSSVPPKAPGWTGNYWQM